MSPSRSATQTAVIKRLSARGATTPMQYLPLFLLLLAALIAGYFYLQRAKARPTNRVEGPNTDTAAPPPAERGPDSDRDA